MRLKDLLEFLPNDTDIDIHFGGWRMSDYCRAYLMGYHDVFNDCIVVGAEIGTNPYKGRKKALLSLSAPYCKDERGKVVDIDREAFEKFMRERFAEEDKEEAEMAAMHEERMAQRNQRRKEREAKKKKLAADLKELEELREWKKKLLSK